VSATATHQAKSMFAILGFCINGGEKDGNCVELWLFGPKQASVLESQL